MKINLESLSKRITDYTLLDDGVSLFLKELCKTGTKFLFLSHLSKTYLDGAAFMQGKSPVIVYTGRYDRVDHFWWTIAHEIAHVLLHLENTDSYFLDNLDNKENISEQEIQADELAGNFLHVEQIIKEAEPYKKYFSRDRLKQVSEIVGVAEPVVLGILQFNKIIDYRTLSDLKEKVIHQIDDEYKKG